MLYFLLNVRCHECSCGFQTDDVRIQICSPETSEVVSEKGCTIPSSHRKCRTAKLLGKLVTKQFLALLINTSLPLFANPQMKKTYRYFEQWDFGGRSNAPNFISPRLDLFHAGSWLKTDGLLCPAFDILSLPSFVLSFPHHHSGWILEGLSTAESVCGRYRCWGCIACIPVQGGHIHVLNLEFPVLSNGFWFNCFLCDGLGRGAWLLPLGLVMPKMMFVGKGNTSDAACLLSFSPIVYFCEDHARAVTTEVTIK